MRKYSRLSEKTVKVLPLKRFAVRGNCQIVCNQPSMHTYQITNNQHCHLSNNLTMLSYMYGSVISSYSTHALVLLNRCIFWSYLLLFIDALYKVKTSLKVWIMQMHIIIITMKYLLLLMWY